MKTGRVGDCETSGELTKGFRFVLRTHLAVALVALTPQSLPVAPATAFLQTQGQDIVNDQGEKILLCCVGLGNWMLPVEYKYFLQLYNY